MQNREEAIQHLLVRGISGIYPSTEGLREKLLSGKPLKVYLGVDPTGPNLHLGHLTNLLVLKRFQELGHKIIFLVGDFTARIGDPTDKAAPRQALTKKEVGKNMKTFIEQASRIISFSGENPAEIRYNSEWYEKMTLEEFMEELLGYFSVQNLLERNTFDNRIKQRETIRLQEFIYPLLQGNDGVELNVDIEVGGNDQTFNMNIGRALRKARSEGERRKTSKGEKFSIATELLEHPITGKKLMNKSEGGLINLNDLPNEMFGKLMALDDASILPIARLCTEISEEQIKDLKMKKKTRDVKSEVAGWVVQTIYGQNEARKAQEHFDALFSKRSVPADVPEFRVSENPIRLINLVSLVGEGSSISERRRLIEQGAVDINEKPAKNPNEKLTLKDGDILKIGKKKFFRISIKK